MTYSRDSHHIVYHYADGVADILGLSTAQQLAIRTAMHLALREQAAGYEATAADAATRIHLLANELEAALSSLEQLSSAQLSPILHIPPGEPAVTIISTNGAQPSSISVGQTEYQAHLATPGFIAEAAQEAAATETQPDPTPATAAETRRSAEYKWPTLDDVSLEIVKQLTARRRQWQSVTADDKRIIVLATIGELGQDLPPGETLSIETFNRHKPRWMPTFASVSTSLGMTWKQMLAAAPQL